MKIFMLLPLLLWGINAGLLLPPLPVRQRWKWLLAALLIPGAFKFPLFRIFGGPHFFAPAIPGWIQWIASWFFCLLILSAMFLLVFLPVRLFLDYRRRLHPDKPYRRIILCLNAGIVAAALLTGTIGIANGVRLPEVRRTTVDLPLPPDVPPFTVAVLADLHVSRMTETSHIAAMVERVQACRPDVIVLLGDLVDGTPAECGAALEPLAGLRAPWGVYAVTGNHEYFSGAEVWIGFLGSRGIPFLQNGSVTLPNGVILGGIVDHAAKRFGGDAPDLAKTYAGTPPDAVKILLAHRPGIAPEAARAGVHLQLSGHTHGGMMPLLDRFVAQANGGMTSGRYRRDGLTVIVSNGSSIWAGFPVRIACPPEILLLTIRPAAADD